MRTVTVSLALLTLSAPALAADAGGNTSSPGRAFANDVAAAHRQGWHVANLTIDYVPGADGDEILTLDMSKGRAAQSLTLRFAEWGAKVASYDRLAIAPPDEQRVYRFEDELVSALSGSAVVALEEECGAWSLNAGAAGAYLSDDDYYVVTASATGGEAQRQLATILSAQLAAGDTLSGVAAGDDDGAPAIDLTLSGVDTTVLHVLVDEHARVQGFEARVSPGGYTAQTLRGGAPLGKRLARAKMVRTLRLDERSGALIGTTDGGRRFVVDTNDVERLDDEDGEECGC